MAEMTTEARGVIVAAEKQAKQLGHGFLGAEHLLLGLLASPESTGGRMLVSAGLELPAVQAHVAEAIGETPAPGEDEHLPLTPRVQRFLEDAMRASRRLGSAHCGSEHLLLMMLEEINTLAFHTLEHFRFDIVGTAARIGEVICVERMRTTEAGVATAVRLEVAMERLEHISTTLDAVLARLDARERN